MTAATPRDPSLDSLRGSDVALMILVNVQGSHDDAFALLKHAAWDGFTLADFVFPLFLLIVGLSVPLAFDRPGARTGWTRILRRTVLLFAIGVGLGWLIRPTLDPDMIRWTGVLQRIAIVYLACATVALARRGPGLAALLALVLLAAHSAALLHVGAPGDSPSLAPGAGISGWLDQNFIPGRVLRESWDPEGWLSTLSAVANGLIGVATMRWIRARSPGNAALGALGAALLAAGLLASLQLPINKNLWTASFALLTSGLGLLLWAGLRQIWPAIGRSALARWSVMLGQTALTFYIVHTLLLAVIVRKLPDGETLWAWLYHRLTGLGLTAPVASLLFALIATALCCAIMPWLQRRGWILKL